MTVGKPIAGRLTLQLIRKSIMERHPLRAVNVGKCLCTEHNWWSTRDFTLERSLTNAISAGRHSLGTLLLPNMWNLIRLRTHLNVRNVGKPSGIALPFINMLGFIQERNPTGVLYVAKPLVTHLCLLRIKEFIQERNHMGVSNVAKPSSRSHISLDIR